MFGVPGGGSSLDVIQEAALKKIDFVLTRGETAAVIMAAVTAELSGSVGVALTTKGPGAASGTNGVAYAALDRSPVVFLTDGFTDAECAYVTHQVFDQSSMLAPLTKSVSKLNSQVAATEIEVLIQAAREYPQGPVLIELTSETAKVKINGSVGRTYPMPMQPNIESMNKALALIESAKKPVIIIGLEARSTEAANAIGKLSLSLCCPVLATYKAKGVFNDSHPQYVGEFTSGAAEVECVEQADLILLCGLDPVELLRQPWRYLAPVIDAAMVSHDVHYLKPTVGLHGALVDIINNFSTVATQKYWTIQEISTLRKRYKSLLVCGVALGISPQSVIEIAAEHSRSLKFWPRITVDAGAHMFSAMAFWPCHEPFDVLISNGLATMGFALPAAIASALHDPHRITIAYTGDGGLFMCLAELSTAVQQKAKIIVIVFNDGALSLIDIKQQQRCLPVRGVRWERPDFATVMAGLGGRGYRVSTVKEYSDAFIAALSEDGPVLIDVNIDPSGYLEQLKALRG